MNLRIVGVAAIAAIGGATLAGCGATEVMVRSQSADQANIAEGDDCSVQYQTLAVAMEAYWASTGGLPASEGDLISAAMLREEIDDFDVIIADSDYELVGLYSCAGFDPEMPQAVVDIKPMPDRACDADRRALQNAWEAFNADIGRPPASEAEIVQAGLLYEASLGFDLVGTEIVPVPGVCD